MCVKVKIVNKSKRELPEEVIEALTFKTVSEANDILEEYNLKIVEYERVLKDAKIKEQIFTIGSV